MNSLVIHSDGGARGNPGPAAIGFTIHQTDKLLGEKGQAIGNTTNNVAEYTAVLRALEWVSEQRKMEDDTRIDCYLDSLLIVKQMRGEYKIKQAHLYALKRQVDEAIAGLKALGCSDITFTHIPRAQNTRADSLVNQALDAL